MKAKKLLALVLTLCLTFSCIAVIPFTATVAAAAETTATTSAVWIGPSKVANINNRAESLICMPLTLDDLQEVDGQHDGILAQIKFDYKVLSGSKPVVSMIRPTYTNQFNEQGNWYDDWWQDSSDNHFRTMDTKPSWVNNGTSEKANPKSGADPIPAVVDNGSSMTVSISFADIPGIGGCYYSGYRIRESGKSHYYRTGYTGSAADAIWGMITIGNCALSNDNAQNYDSTSEFIISNPVLTVNGKEQKNLVVDFSKYDNSKVYSIIGGVRTGDNNDATNTPFNAQKHKWSKLTTDPDTIKFVTVADDYLTATHTYTQVYGTTTTREYYTCSDIPNKKFEKVGTGCYNVIPNDIAKKTIIIGKSINQVSCNLEIPLYIHKYFSGVNGSNKVFGESDGNCALKIEFKAKRLEGTGKPMLGYMYPYQDNRYAHGATSQSRAYNDGDINNKRSGSDYIGSTYDPATGNFVGYICCEKGYYAETSTNGASAFVTIGNCEHDWNGGKEYDNSCFDSSFAISDIRFTVYETEDINGTVVGTDFVPEMTVGNYFIKPSTDEVDDHSTQFCYQGADSGKGSGKVERNGRKTGSNYMPINTWCCDGAQYLMSVVDKTSCNSDGSHTLTHHNASVSGKTREYWSCSCGKMYADEYASKEITNYYVTNKMIAVKASGSAPANAVFTLNQPNTPGVHYYKFTCDMRVFGDDVPTIGAVKGSWWGGNGAQSETSWVNNSEEANTDGLYSYYDADAHKYTAIVKADIPTGSTYGVDYFNALSGAYAGFTLGNGYHVGANGYYDTKYFSSFIFANPEMYEITDVNDEDSTTGENLVAPITDATFISNMNYVGTTKQQYNTENTMYRPNNLLAVPSKTWAVDNSLAWVKALDIPVVEGEEYGTDNEPGEAFFSGEDTKSRMVRISGALSNYNALNVQTFLEANETYQFDIDYREFGSDARIELETAALNSEYTKIYNKTNNKNVGVTETAANVPGAHMSLQFTMPESVNNIHDGNFRLWLGHAVANGTNKNTTSVYFANAKLRKVTNGVLGDNLFMNGSFAFGKDGDIKDDANKTAQLFGWDAGYYNDKMIITSCGKHDLLNIPQGFFEGDIDIDNVTESNGDIRAIRFDGRDWNELHQKVELKPSTTYRLSYRYRATDDLIGLALQGSGTNNQIVDLGTDTSTGYFIRQYNIITGADKTSYGDRDANTRFRFTYLPSSEGSQFTMTDLQLHELDGSGNIVGMNMFGDLNPILNTTDYNYEKFAIKKSAEDAATVNDGHKWVATKDNTMAQIVKVNSHYFDYYSHAARMSYMVNAILGKGTGYNPYNDTANVYYNPNGTGNAHDILDLVKVKKDAANVGDKGGAGAEATAMLNNIMSAPSIATTGTVRYVSASGSDSNAGTEAKPYATLKKAISSSSAGDTILVKRGDTFYVDVNDENGININKGIKISAYGTGDKPLFIGSAGNYADSSKWTNVSGNIWKLNMKNKFYSSLHDANIPGTLYFFNSTTDKEPALIGRVLKLKDGSDNVSTRFTSYNELEKEGDVYYATSISSFTGDVYVYCSQNPATKYGKIYIAEKRAAIGIASDNVTIDNIAVKFTGGHAISATGRNNITITNCEVGYVGGAPNITGSNLDETMGNGIQFGNYGKNLTVDSCYVHDCYDAGLTFQTYTDSSTAANITFDGVNFTNNLLTNNFYNIEFFTVGQAANKGGSSAAHDGYMKNINITGNIMRFAGESWSLYQRADTSLRAANICVTQNAYYVNTQNLKIQGNIFDCTMSQMIFWQWGGLDAHKDKTTHTGVTISGNTYYQKAGSLNGRVNRFGNVTNDHFDYAGSTAALSTAIAAMDTAPVKVEWVNRADKF